MAIDYGLLLAEMRKIRRELESQIDGLRQHFDDPASTIITTSSAPPTVQPASVRKEQHTDGNQDLGERTPVVPSGCGLTSVALLHTDHGRATSTNVIDRPAIVDHAALHDLAYPPPTTIRSAPPGKNSSWGTSHPPAALVCLPPLLRLRCGPPRSPRLRRPWHALPRPLRLHRPWRAPPCPPQLCRPPHGPPRPPWLRRPWRAPPRLLRLRMHARRGRLLRCLVRPPRWRLTWCGWRPRLRGHRPHARRGAASAVLGARQGNGHALCPLPQLPRLRRCLPLPPSRPRDVHAPHVLRLHPQDAFSTVPAAARSKSASVSVKALKVFGEMSHRHQPPTASELAPVFTSQCAALASAMVLHAHTADQGAVLSARDTMMAHASMSLSVSASAQELFGRPLRRYITMLFPTPMMDDLLLDCVVTMHDGHQRHQKMTELGSVMLWPPQFHQRDIFSYELENYVDLRSPWPPPRFLSLQIVFQSLGVQPRPIPWPSFRYSHAVLKNLGEVFGVVIFLLQRCITEVDLLAALDGTGFIQCCLCGELCVTIHPWLLPVGGCEFTEVVLWCLWAKLWPGTTIGQQVKCLFLSCVFNPKAMQQNCNNKFKDIYCYNTSIITAMKAKACSYLLLEKTELQRVTDGKMQLSWASSELLLVHLELFVTSWLSDTSCVVFMFSLEPRLDEGTTLLNNAKLLHQVVSSTVIQIAFLSRITYLYNPWDPGGVQTGHRLITRRRFQPQLQHSLGSSIQYASISAGPCLRLLQSSVVSLIYNTCWVQMKHFGVCINFWSITSEFSEHRQPASPVAFFAAKVAHPTGVLKSNTSSEHQLSPETSPVGLTRHDYIVLSPWPSDSITKAGFALQLKHLQVYAQVVDDP